MKIPRTKNSGKLLTATLSKTQKISQTEGKDKPPKYFFFRSLNKREFIFQQYDFYLKNQLIHFEEH